MSTSFSWRDSLLRISIVDSVGGSSFLVSEIMVYWPLGIANRMNSGQLAEAHTGLIAKKLAELAGKLSRNEFIKTYYRVLIWLPYHYVGHTF